MLFPLKLIYRTNIRYEKDILLSVAFLNVISWLVQRCSAKLMLLSHVILQDSLTVGGHSKMLIVKKSICLCSTVALNKLDDKF